jgi:hypothetical protein
LDEQEWPEETALAAPPGDSDLPAAPTAQDVADAVADAGADALALMTAETVDLARYYTPDELRRLSDDALEELWRACPDPAFYATALDQAIRDAHGDSQRDLDRLDVIAQCLALYAESSPRIPSLQGANAEVKWFRVPEQVRESLACGAPLEPEAPAAHEAQTNQIRLRLGLAAGLLVVVCLGLFLVFRALTADPEEAQAAPTAASDVPIALLSPREASPTPSPTPLALDDLDRPLQGGEGLRGYYPVLLELIPTAQPNGARVFPVQQKAVDLAQWDFDPNPDVASAVYGLVIRPVLGIPYSPANAEYLDSLQAGDAIEVQMNTGQTLAFALVGRQRVQRQAVELFDQSAPGIVIVLLGDPAPDRLVLLGAYQDAQELAAPQTLAGAQIAEMGQPLALGASGLTLTVQDAATHPGPAEAPLPPEWAYLMVDLAFQAGDALDTAAVQFELLDGSGARYAPIQPAPGLVERPYAPLSLQAAETQTATLVFLVPRATRSATLLVRTGPGEAPAAYTLRFSPPGGASATSLDVLLLGVEMSRPKGDAPGTVTVQLRLFNPQAQGITVGPSDFTVIFSPASAGESFPVGPATPPLGLDLPLTLAPNEARDLSFSLPWHGDPTLGLAVGGYQFLIALEAQP